jgi:hypothetical protein
MQEKINEINEVATKLSDVITKYQADENNWARLQALSRTKEAVIWAITAASEAEKKNG